MNERPLIRTGGYGRRTTRSQQIDYAEYQASAHGVPDGAKRSSSDQGSEGTVGHSRESSGLTWHVRGLGC